MPDPLLDKLFIGAGAMKAGTTWLYTVLGGHPDIHFTPEKEIHYFYAAHVNPGILSEKNRLENIRKRHVWIDPETSRATAVKDRLRWAANYLDGPVDDHWYRGLFALRRKETWVADFSNLYALLPSDAWPRIAARTHDLRVLYTMREPVARLWSHLKFHLMIIGEDTALDTWSHAKLERFVRQDFIWENAEYGIALRRMQDGLTGEQLHACFFEDVHRDPRAALSDIETFLGVSHHAFSQDTLRRRVNATAARPVPAWFQERMAEDAGRIAAEVADLGLTPPAAWAEVRAAA